MTDHGIRITQRELQELFDLRREVELRQKRADELTSNVKAMLISKIPVEDGRYAAWLSTKTFHHPAWKQAVIDHLGPGFAEAIRKSSPTTVVSDVIVEEHAVPPLWRGTVGGSEATS